MDEIELVDIADDLLIINKTTIERLFQDNTQNALILYLFYYKTAKWQKTNPIKASDDYCKKCLHWGIDKIQETKKRLKELELIETIRRTNERGEVVGWYIKVNYLVDDTRIPKTTIPISPQLVSQETNTINNNILNTNNNKDTKERFKKPTLKEIEEYCKERNKGVDAKKFFDYYEVSNWTDSKGNKVKNWKQKVITWEKHQKEAAIPYWMEKDFKPELEGAEEMEDLLDGIISS